MSARPDTLIDGDSAGECGKDSVLDECETVEWIVRLERRDAECQFRFIDRYGNVNSRLSSAMRLAKEDARQLAKAISDLHPKYRARAMLFKTMHKRQEVAK